MVEKNMVTLTERTIMKSRSGVYSDTAENRRKHRVGQKYGAEKQPDIDDGFSIPDTLINKFDSKDKIAIKRAIADSKKDGKIRYVFSSPDGDIGISTNSNGMGDELLFTIGKEKTEKKEADPAKELEAVNKGIAAINEGKLNLPAAEVMKLSEKKQKLEAAKKQAEKINSGVKANEEKKNAEEAKETSKKINEAQKKEASKKKYSEMDIKEARKELLGKKITFKEYFFDGVDSYKDAVGEIKQVRLYGKEKQPVLSTDFPNGDSVQISLKQLDERKASKYEIVFNEKVGEDKTEEKETDPEKERVSLSGWESNSLSDVKNYGEKGVVESMSVQSVPNLKEMKYEYSAAVSASRIAFDESEEFRIDSEKLREKKFASPNDAARAADDFANKWNSKDLKSEPKQSEAEESYSRIKFDDVPNSGKINLKKYLSEKVRKGVDEKWSSIKKIPTENLKKMEKGLVNDLNKNFEAIKKSQRAELLYSIMKVKGELASRGKETQKKE